MSSTDLKEYTSLAVALIAIILFSGFVVYMMRIISVEETSWSRAVYLLNGVEAVAFAAAGFLFGREVNRQRADEAEERATDAETRAIKAETSQNNGGTLATLIRIKAEDVPFKVSQYKSLDSEIISGLIKIEFDELLALANRLFPENVKGIPEEPEYFSEQLNGSQRETGQGEVEAKEDKGESAYG